MAKEFDGFIFHVKILEFPDIQISDDTDNQTVAAGEAVNYQFIYQGGIGTATATEFKIFVYDRSDTTTDTVPRWHTRCPVSKHSRKNRSLLLLL